MRRPLIALALAATVAACGGDDGLSTEEYRDRATVICRESREATDAVEQPTRSTNAAIAAYFERLMAISRRTTAQFAKLEPPEELADAHDDALAANREGVDEVQRLIRELERGGDARALLQGATGRLQQLSSRSRAAADRLGVPECARQE